MQEKVRKKNIKKIINLSFLYFPGRMRYKRGHGFADIR